MCIIVAKASGVKMPTRAELKNCWDNNDDGAGIAWVEGGVVRIRKGFMTKTMFFEFLDKLERRIKLDETHVVMHFRITSAGATTPKMTHPFRVDTPDDADRALLSNRGKMFLFHNGTISHFSGYKSVESDTFHFTKNIMHEFYRINRRFLENEHFLNVIENLIDGDKLAIIEPQGITLLGTFVEHNKVYYSNSGYSYSYPTKYWYSSYEDDSTTYTTGTSKVVDYYDAKRKVRAELDTLYVDYTESRFKRFMDTFQKEIDTVVDYELYNSDNLSPNLMLTYELEELGVI